MRYFLFVLLLLFSSCRQLGTCDQKEEVSFRGVKFRFPIRASDVVISPPKAIYSQSRWVQTDFITKNTSALWFFDWPDVDHERRGKLDYLKEARVYGVTFFLHDKEFASDEEIVKELQKWYPGDYECVEYYGMHYYTLDKGCLRIIYNWASTYTKDSKYLPAVSFCYGLEDSEYHAYAIHNGATYIGEFD